MCSLPQGGMPFLASPTPTGTARMPSLLVPSPPTSHVVRAPRRGACQAPCLPPKGIEPVPVPATAHEPLPFFSLPSRHAGAQHAGLWFRGVDLAARAGRTAGGQQRRRSHATAPDRSAPCTKGKERDLPLHERRSRTNRHLRSQAAPAKTRRPTRAGKHRGQRAENSALGRGLTADGLALFVQAVWRERHSCVGAFSRNRPPRRRPLRDPIHQSPHPCARSW